MKKNILIVMAIFVNINIMGQNLYTKDIKEKAEAIVSDMTLEEKIGQMAQVSIDAVCKGEDTPPKSTLTLDVNKLRDVLVNYHVGSILNSPNTRARTPKWWNQTIETMQLMVQNETRMKIPVIYGLDQIHGATYTAGSTMFPQQITLAASFNPTYARVMGEVTAYEIGRASCRERV